MFGNRLGSFTATSFGAKPAVDVYRQPDTGRSGAMSFTASKLRLAGERGESERSLDLFHDSHSTTFSEETDNTVVLFKRDKSQKAISRTLEKNTELEPWRRNQMRRRKEQLGEAEVADLRAKLEQSQRGLAQSQEKNRELKRQHVGAHEENSNNTQISVLRERVARAEIEHLSQSLLRTQEVASKVTDLEDFSNQVVSENELLSDKLEECRGQLSAAEVRIESLTKRLVQMREHREKHAYIRARSEAHLLSDSQHSRAPVDQLKQQLAEAEIESLVEQLALARKEADKVSALEALLLQETEEKKQLSSQLDQYRDQVSTVRIEITSLKAQLEENSVLESLIQEKIDENEELCSQLEDCYTQLSSKDAEIESLGCTQVENSRLYRGELVSAQSEIKALTVTLEGLSSPDRTAELEDMVEQKNGDIEKLEVQLDQYRHLLSEKEEELEVSGKKELENLRPHQDPLVCALSRIESLEAELEATRSQADKAAELEILIQHKMDESIKLKDKLAHSRRDFGGQDADTMSPGDTTHLEEMRRENIQLNGLLEDMREQMAFTDDKNLALLRKLADMEKEAGLLEECRGQLSAARVEIDSLTSGLVATRVSLAKSNKARNSSTAADGESTVSLSDDTEDFQELKRETTRMRSVLENLEDLLQSSDEKNTSLQKKVTKLEKDLKTEKERSFLVESQSFVGEEAYEGSPSSRAGASLSALRQELLAAQAVAKENYNEVLDLKIVVERKESEIGNLKAKLEKEASLCTALRAQVRDFEVQLVDADTKEKTLENSLSASKEGQRIAEEECERVKEDLAENKKSLKSARQEIDALEKTARQLREAEHLLLEQSSTTIKTLRNELEESIVRPDEIDWHGERNWEQEQQIEQLEMEKAELGNEIDKLHSQLSAFLSANAQLEEHTKDMEHTLTAVGEQHTILEHEAKGRLEKTELLIEEFTELEEKLQQETFENEHLHQILGDLQSELAEAKTANASMAKRLESSDGNESDKDQVILELRQELEATTVKANNFQIYAGNLAASSRTLGSAAEKKEIDNQKLHDEVKELQTELKAAKTLSQGLEEELKHARERVSKLSSTGSSTRELMKQLAELVAERDELQKQLKVTNQSSEALTGQGRGFQFDCVDDKIDRMSADSAAEEDVMRLREDRDRSLKQATDLSVQLADSQMLIDQLSREVKKGRTLSDSDSVRSLPLLRRTSSIRRNSLASSASDISKKISNKISQYSPKRSRNDDDLTVNKFFSSHSISKITVPLPTTSCMNNATTGGDQ